MIVTLLAAALAIQQSQLLPGPKVGHRPGQINPMKVDRLNAYWRQAAEEEYKSPQEILAHIDRDKKRGRMNSLLIEGHNVGKKIALTFDDGPHPKYTPKILDILAREKVKATFFVIGFMAERYPSLVVDEAQAGHTIGNHTFSHVTLTHLPHIEAATEYRACSDVILKFTGRYPEYCRPPGGDYSSPVVQAGRLNGMTTVLWTDDPGDYKNPGPGVLERVTLSKITPGGIILLHDGSDDTLKVLPKIIEMARARGYQFVSLKDLR